MGSTNTNKRVAPRKEVSPIHVSYLTSLDDFAKIAKDCEIVEASSTGLLLLITREDLIPSALRKNLNLDCLIGDRFHPFYPKDRGKDLGVTTWPGSAWKVGGGTVWGWISYDPEAALPRDGRSIAVELRCADGRQ